MRALNRVGKTEALTMLRRREAELSFELPAKAVERFSKAFFPRDGMAVEERSIKDGIELLFQINMTDSERDAINPLLLDLPPAKDLEDALATFGAAMAVGALSDEMGQELIRQTRLSLKRRLKQDATIG